MDSEVMDCFQTMVGKAKRSKKAAASRKDVGEDSGMVVRGVCEEMDILLCALREAQNGDAVEDGIASKNEYGEGKELGDEDGEDIEALLVAAAKKSLTLSTGVSGGLDRCCFRASKFFTPNFVGQKRTKTLRSAVKKPRANKRGKKSSKSDDEEVEEENDDDTGDENHSRGGSRQGKGVGRIKGSRAGLRAPLAPLSYSNDGNSEEEFE